MIKVPLSGYIRTNSEGYNALIDFYNTCKSLFHQKIDIDLSNLVMLEGNLCAFWLALIDDLKRENRLEFYVDACFWQGDNTKFNLFFRNKFMPHLADLGNEFKGLCTDNRNSTIEVRKFSITQEDDFVDYIQNSFLEHNRININGNTKDKLLTAYSELFNNFVEHTKTDNPVYVCGQFFPTLNKLHFTMTDAGIGFLKPISEYTKDTLIPVTSAKKAIDWALEGNTTRKSGEGGKGLKTIQKICSENQGEFHIISDNWYAHYNPTHKQVTGNLLKGELFRGVSVHLIF